MVISQKFSQYLSRESLLAFRNDNAPYKVSIHILHENYGAGAEAAAANL